MNLDRLFAYDDWANREELAHLRALATPAEGAIRLLAHIVGTEWLWLARLRGEAPKMAVWPDLALDAFAAELDALRGAWRDYLVTAPLDRSIAYRNTKGESWTSGAGDVLTHVVLHGAYHRGQIATLVRQSGQEPPYTDYIQCTRMGFI